MLNPVAKDILNKHNVEITDNLEAAISEIIKADLKPRSLIDEETKLKRLRGEI
ncbi:hypothetical protein ACR9FV_08675 [Streptococcus dysgalactiae subsp. equisimilis]|uniref:hypothetical protein n=1 Tax=Streptococcus TaxID=1301 RepID=UPI000E073AF4|nr:hypothetical protein [Streptococcus dysgalactiae]MCY7220415.1 hypothetical protein [Streptococcus dysgalactiae]GET70440.1 hypothetical protein KNZ03_09990 [Streptococcus dysgalactiae subsp. equisimilis]HEP5083688.1 hypothetical protein [Streptococcus pyogenes]HEP5358649.1 hypothetical protein [Streptococcus pyogenes]